MRSIAPFVLAFSLVALACCNGDDDDPDDPRPVPPIETQYLIDDVPVVTENGNGPAEDRMRSAIETYRTAAMALFSIDAAVEALVWSDLLEIRWDDGLVPPVGGTYDFANYKVLLEYHGCLIDPPLFEMLATHYHYQLSSNNTLPTETVQWAEELSAANTELCAP